MKNFKNTVFLLLLFAGIASAQVGIGTVTPSVTLDVKGQPTTYTVKDGVTIPKLTCEQLYKKHRSPAVTSAAYTVADEGTLVYISGADTDPALLDCAVNDPFNGNVPPVIAADITSFGEGLYQLDKTVVFRRLPIAVGSISTLYNGDSSITSERTVTLGANNLNFNTSAAGRIGIGTNGPAGALPYNLNFGNAASQSIGVLQTGSTVAGTDLTLSAGNTGTGGDNNLAGGSLFLASGAGVGTGGSTIQFQTATPGAFNNTPLNTRSTKMTILGNGFVGIGTTMPASRFDIVSQGNNGTDDDFKLSSYTGATSPSIGILMNSSRGTVAAPANLNAADNIGNILFRGRTAGAENSLSYIRAFYQGNGTTSLSTLDFGASDITRMTIANNGFVGIGTTTPGAPLHVVNTTNLGTATGNTANIQTLSNNASGANNLILRTYARRWAAGPDWTKTSLRIEKTVDISNHGFIDFGVNGVNASEGLGFGVRGVTHMQMNNVGEVSGSAGFVVVYGLKYGLQNGDHNGWYLLDGRTCAIATTAGTNARTRCTAKWGAGAMPNANNANGGSQQSATYFGNIDGNTGTVVGTIGGNTDNRWSSGDLPNLSHSHRIDVRSNGSNPGQILAGSDRANDGFKTTQLSNPGGAVAIVPTSPRTMDANAFVYLGL